ncbi:MAG: Plug domain-containing protein, partial [Kiritimatiellae bacterium]|nr:Plug domain-containing protein [Kiritimatiellia bacterium]
MAESQTCAARRTHVDGGGRWSKNGRKVCRKAAGEAKRPAGSGATGHDATFRGRSQSFPARVRGTRGLPQLLGEADVLKSLQLLPGVQSGSSGSSGLYVRGGGPDENLVMMDGIPLYNGEHLLGLFSVFAPDAVKKVTLYKSSFPARYGGRTSSIV